MHAITHTCSDLPVVIVFLSCYPFRARNSHFHSRSVAHPVPLSSSNSLIAIFKCVNISFMHSHTHTWLYLVFTHTETLAAARPFTFSIFHPKKGTRKRTTTLRPARHSIFWHLTGPRDSLCVHQWNCVGALRSIFERSKLCKCIARVWLAPSARSFFACASREPVRWPTFGRSSFRMVDAELAHTFVCSTDDCIHRRECCRATRFGRIDFRWRFSR